MRWSRWAATYRRGYQRQRAAKVSDLPVEMTSRLQLIINLKTAKALGLTTLPSVLARADEVIQ